MMRYEGGRHLFGAAIALSGALVLSSQHDAIAYLTAAALIVGGIALQGRRSIVLGAVLVLIVYGILACERIPGIVAAPRVYNNWNSFFEQFAMVSGALILCGGRLRGTGAMLVRRIGVLGFGLCLVSFALEQAFYLAPTASLVPAWIPPAKTFWAIATTVAFGMAGIAFLTRRFALLAARLTTLMLAIFGLLVWMPLTFGNPHNLANWSEMLETFAICGVAWIVAGALARGRSGLRAREPARAP